MSRSPIFRRITLTEVKKTTNRRGSLLRELADLEREEKEIIKNHHDPSYSNWRASFLREEGMTTDGFMQTQLKGEGDTDLATIEGNVASSYEAYEGGSDALSNTAITSSGTGSGSDGGFDLGEDYLGFNGNETPRYAALKPIDASKFDTIVVTGIRGNDNNGGEDPDETNEDLMVYYQLPGQNTIQRLDVNEGVTQSGIDYKIIPVGSDDSGLKEWSLTLPSYTRAANVRFILYQPSHHGTGFDNYGITQINYRRVKPISVMVSLDSPEASAFIRVGSPSKPTESKKKREQQLREQLEATKDYTDKKFGENFPGSEVAAPGEEDPTEVEKKAPGLGEFEPEVEDYNTWKQEIKAEDPQAKTTEKEFEKWKDEKALKAFAAVRDAQQGGVLPSPPSPPTPPVDAQDTKSFDTFQKVADLHATPGVTDAEKEVGARIAEKEPEEIEAALKDMEKALDKDKFYEPKREDFPPGLEGTKAWRKAKNEDAFASIAQQIGSAGKVYINYLLGNLKDGAINNEFLGQEYVNSLIKNVDVSKGHGVQSFTPTGSTTPGLIFVGGDNVIGSGGTPTYDPKTGIVTFPFNYDFNTNFEEIYGQLGTGKFDFNTDDSLSVVDRIKASDSQQIVSFLGMFAAWVLGGKYGLDSVPVPGAGYATWLAKLLGKAQGTTGHAITMSLDDIKKLNPDLAKQLKDTGILNPPGEWEGTEEQKTQLYDDISDLYDTDPDQFDEFIERVNTNPEYVKLRDEQEAAREKFDTDQKVAQDKNSELLKRSIRLYDLSYGGKSLRASINAGDTARAEEIAKEGGIDYKEYQNLQKKFQIGDAQYKAGKGQSIIDMDYKWAENQPEYKEAVTAKNDAKKAQDAAWKPYEKALSAAAAYERSLPRHPTKKGYVTGTPSQLAELNRLAAAVAPLRSAYEKAESTAFNTQQAEAKLRIDLARERRAADNKMYDMSSEADKNIKKAREEAQREMKELNYRPTRYVPDPDLLDRLMNAWDKAAYDALNPQAAQIADTSLHGKQIALDLRDKLVKNLEDAAKRGDIEAVEKAQEKLKDHDDKQLPPPKGFPDPTKDPDAYQDFDLSAQIPQQDFGSIAQAYGGQGVDAATLASTAAELNKKKKKEAAASLPELEKLVARTSKAEKEAYDELKMAALDYGMDVVSVISAVGSGGLSLLPAAIRKVAGKKLVKKVLNKFKTKTQKKADRRDFANRMQQDVGNPTGTSDTRNLTGGDNAFQRFQKQDAQRLKKRDHTLDQLDRYRKNEGLPPFKKKNLKNSYEPKGSMITERRKLKTPSQWFNPDDIKPEHPKDPPPEMVNNYHPDLVDSSKKAERFNKLDPASAKAMPKQDDPNIDAKVEKAKNNPDKDGPGWHKQVSDKIRKARAQQRKG